MSEQSIFEKILARELPAQIIFEDDLAFAIKDINPVAPHHYLVIPKERIDKLSDATAKHHSLLGHLLRVAARVAEDQGIEDYRVVINNGAGAGQSVFHIHLHVIGGRPLHWPPG